MPNTTTHPVRFVNLHRKHDGQICSPVVTEQVIRGKEQNTILEVKWWWVDLSIPRGREGREYAHGSCRGRVETCRKALRREGILVDDSRSWV